MAVMVREPRKGWRDGINAARRALHRRDHPLTVVPDRADECPDEVEAPDHDDDGPPDRWQERADLQ